jgi:hypothetical protein
LNPPKCDENFQTATLIAGRVQTRQSFEATTKTRYKDFVQFHPDFTHCRHPQNKISTSTGATG